MAERFKAAVLKTVERKLRGFESLSLRHIKPNNRLNRFNGSNGLNRVFKNGEVAERLKAAAC